MQCEHPLLVYWSFFVVVKKHLKISNTRAPLWQHVKLGCVYVTLLFQIIK